MDSEFGFSCAVNGSELISGLAQGPYQLEGANGQRLELHNQFRVLSTRFRVAVFTRAQYVLGNDDVEGGGGTGQ